MKKNVLDNVEEILLMGPGPSCIHETVYEALGRKTLGHMDPYFIHIMDEIGDGTGNVNAKMMARVLLTEMIKAGRVIPD